MPSRLTAAKSLLSTSKSSSASVESEFLKQLLDHDDMYIVGTIYTGSMKQRMSVVYDTGSPWIWIQGEECTNCSSFNLFESSRSTSYNQLSNTPKKIAYVTGDAKGYQATDQICITPNDCMQNVKFLNIFQSADLEDIKIDGILGLSPYDYRNLTDLFVDSLYKNQMIDERVFSFQIGNFYEKSVFTMGGYDANLYGDGDIHWHNLTTDEDWLINQPAVYLDGFKIDTVASAAAIDSGSSFSAIPRQDFESILDILS